MATSLKESKRKERRSWYSVVAIALGAFSLVIAELLPVGLLTEISKDLQVTEGTAGLMVTGTGLLAAIGAPVTTIAIGRLDRRNVLLGPTLMLLVSSGIPILTGELHSLLQQYLLLSFLFYSSYFFQISLRKKGLVYPTFLVYSETETCG
ncbi:hypothetical protein [Paenibacillus sp. GCM10027626]|uniref:hypothetical protein n=1 Tax=Paenibacillus sp. GCM10027626 TaxID=3273411 RepID=UPI00363B5F96